MSGVRQGDSDEHGFGAPWVAKGGGWVDDPHRPVGEPRSPGFAERARRIGLLGILGFGLLGVSIFELSTHDPPYVPVFSLVSLVASVVLVVMIAGNLNAAWRGRRSEAVRLCDWLQAAIGAAYLGTLATMLSLGIFT